MKLSVSLFISYLLAIWGKGSLSERANKRLSNLSFQLVLLQGCTVICHFTRTKAYLCSLNKLYFLTCSISSHNFLKPQ